MESRMREIRTYGLTRGKSHRRQRRGVGLYSTLQEQYVLHLRRQSARRRRRRRRLPKHMRFSHTPTLSRTGTTRSIPATTPRRTRSSWPTSLLSRRRTARSSARTVTPHPTSTAYTGTVAVRSPGRSTVHGGGAHGPPATPQSRQSPIAASSPRSRARAIPRAWFTMRMARLTLRPSTRTRRSPRRTHPCPHGSSSG